MNQEEEFDMAMRRLMACAAAIDLSAHLRSAHDDGQGHIDGTQETATGTGHFCSIHDGFDYAGGGVTAITAQRAFSITDNGHLAANSS